MKTPKRIDFFIVLQIVPAALLWGTAVLTDPLDFLCIPMVLAAIAGGLYTIFLACKRQLLFLFRLKSLLVLILAICFWVIVEYFIALEINAPALGFVIMAIIFAPIQALWTFGGLPLSGILPLNKLSVKSILSANRKPH